MEVLGLRLISLNRKRTMKRTAIKLLMLAIIGVLVIVMSGCTGQQGAATDETPTRGNIRIAVDESFSLLLDTELYTFHTFYQYAHVTPLYLPENDVIDYFLSDSIRTIVTTRKLTKDQEEYFSSRQIIPKTTTIAYDALAIIVNRSNPDSFLMYPQVMNIFKGGIVNWNEISKKNNNGKIKVVFDNNKSGNIRYFIEKFGLTGKFASNFIAASSNEQVISYVENNKNALGIVSVNWISDKHDSTSIEFLNRIRVAAITPEYDPEGSDYYKPYQAYIADKSYPFIREVYIITKETFSGLGTGFTAFIAGEKGQRIILRSRLVPATMPIRVIQIKN
jgi:phosphate transport system substrate-binding protein